MFSFNQQLSIERQPHRHAMGIEADDLIPIALRIAHVGEVHSQTRVFSAPIFGQLEEVLPRLVQAKPPQ